MSMIIGVLSMDLSELFRTLGTGMVQSYVRRRAYPLITACFHSQVITIKHQKKKRGGEVTQKYQDHTRRCDIYRAQ